jgi:hypothetical protein
MIDNRRVFLLACAMTYAYACSAHRPPLPPPHDEAAVRVEPEPQPDVELAGRPDGAATNPYTPTRLSLLNSYAWQNPKRPVCSRALGALEPEASYTTQVKLSFSGSVAAFPLLPEDDPTVGSLKPDSDAAALDTWGTGPHPEATANARRDPDFVVASLRPRLRSCFAGLLDRSAEAQGSIRFALELGCAGEVQTISAKAEGVDEPTVECLFAVVAPAMFDPPAGGHATIHVPVVFKNSGR